MKHYELSCLISPNLSQEELKTMQEKIGNFIQEDGGVSIETKNTTSIARKSLPHLIKTKLHPPTETAYLITSDFNLAPEKLEGMGKKLKSESQILRYLILSKKAPRAISPLYRISSRISPKASATSKPRTEKIKKEKVKLEEIEQKIEEILGDT